MSHEQLSADLSDQGPESQYRSGDGLCNLVSRFKDSHLRFADVISKRMHIFDSTPARSGKRITWKRTICGPRWIAWTEDGPPKESDPLGPWTEQVVRAGRKKNGQWKLERKTLPQPPLGCLTIRDTQERDGTVKVGEEGHDQVTWCGISWCGQMNRSQLGILRSAGLAVLMASRDSRHTAMLFFGHAQPRGFILDVQEALCSLVAGAPDDEKLFLSSHSRIWLPNPIREAISIDSSGSATVEQVADWLCDGAMCLTSAFFSDSSAAFSVPWYGDAIKRREMARVAPREEQTPQYHAATDFAGLGLRILQLHSITGTRCTCKKGHVCDRKGKHPVSNGWKEAATNDLLAVGRLWRKVDPWANIGAIVGDEHVVLDVDDPNLKIDDLRERLGLVGIHTLTTRSRRGHHLWYRLPAGTVIPKRRTQRLDGKFTTTWTVHIPGVEVRHGTKQQMVMPGSRWIGTEDGEWVEGEYRQVDIGPEGGEIAQAPDSLLVAMGVRGAGSVQGTVTTGALSQAWEEAGTDRGFPRHGEVPLSSPHPPETRASFMQHLLPEGQALPDWVAQRVASAELSGVSEPQRAIWDERWIDDLWDACGGDEDLVKEALMDGVDTELDDESDRERWRRAIENSLSGYTPKEERERQGLTGRGKRRRKFRLRVTHGQRALAVQHALSLLDKRCNREVHQHLIELCLRLGCRREGKAPFQLPQESIGAELGVSHTVVGRAIGRLVDMGFLRQKMPARWKPDKEESQCARWSLVADWFATVPGIFDTGEDLLPTSDSSVVRHSWNRPTEPQVEEVSTSISSDRPP